MSLQNIPSLDELVFREKKQPTIVNTDSNFVVVTYWWGRGNLNQNIARPCVSFYENFATQITKFTLKYLEVMYHPKTQQKVAMTNVDSIVKYMPQHIISLNAFINMTQYFAKVYVDSVFSDVNLIDNKNTNRFSNAKDIIDQMKREGSCPAEFALFEVSTNEINLREQAQRIFTECAKQLLLLNATSLVNTIHAKLAMNKMKDKYTTSDDDDIKNSVKDIIIVLANEGKQLTKDIQNNMKLKITFTAFGKTFTNISILDVLNIYLRHRSAMKFEDMITRWEQACAKANCNYLAVEYDYFSRNRLYQLAINAKPMFIKHALQLCNGRAAVYIDGDMFIRKYPAIFDMKNIDFMSRGWNIDPRSSYNNGNSIMYNPYKFETSGGIMYFSNSSEAIALMDMWIDESAKTYNLGKADDRILSMIFNARKFLLNMNIIQLPIEYLWLTLDYDDRMLEHIYDWDKNEMDESIFIDHPECLTSEETAEGAGSSSDRSPKLHKFLDSEEDDIPVSEEFYEAFMFPSADMAKQFNSYHTYMSKTPYIDDGNPILYEKKLVDKANPTNNEYPMYITTYDKGYGKKQKTVDNNLKIVTDELNNIYWTSGNGQNIINTRTDADNTIILCENSIPGEEYTIPMILALLARGHAVIYLPATCKNECYLSLIKDRRLNIELLFIPDIKNMEHILKPVIDMSQPIYFNQESDLSLLSKALAMYTSIEEFAYSLSIGNYQVISRIRIGYAFKSKGKPDISSFCSARPAITNSNRNIIAPSPLSQRLITVGGNRTRGGGVSQADIDEYIAGQQTMYGAGVPRHKSHKIKSHKIKPSKSKRRTNKRTRRNKK